MAFIAEGPESKLFVKANGILIDGIHDHGVNGNLVADGQYAFDRIGQQDFPNTMLLGGEANRQPSDQSAGYGVFRQLAGKFGG